jgi:hypothetical protein
MPYVFEIENSEENILVLPETLALFLWKHQFSKIQKIIWWLSVTNFFITLENIEKRYKKKSFFFIKKRFKDYPLPSLEKVKKANVLHIAHSYFSLDFLKENNISTIGQISDYMNDAFLLGNDYKSFKEDCIIYNPTKNGDFLEKIMNLTPELNWIPIQNMTPEQVSDTMKKAKVYIDFGYHPGKERMPRESCLMDCCLIIGKDGSAKYKEDMPIMDQYHFEKDKKNISEIIEMIKKCLLNYNEQIKDFDNYKKILLNEKNAFGEAIDLIFKNKK